MAEQIHHSNIFVTSRAMLKKEKKCQQSNLSSHLLTVVSFLANELPLKYKCREAERVRNHDRKKREFRKNSYTQVIVKRRPQNMHKTSYN